MITAAVVALTLLVLAPAFSHLPLAVLGGIVLVVALGLADLSGLRELRSLRLRAFRLALVAAIGVLLLGVLGGILLAVVISLLVLLYQLNHPPIVTLGRDPAYGAYRPLGSDPALTSVRGLRIVRLESQLYFANARRVMTRLRALAVTADPPATVLLLDASAVTDVDVTAVEAFEQLHDDLAAAEIELWIADLQGSGLDLAARRPRWEGAQDRLLPTLDAGLAKFQSRS